MCGLSCSDTMFGTSQFSCLSCLGVAILTNKPNNPPLSQKSALLRNVSGDYTGLSPKLLASYSSVHSHITYQLTCIHLKCCTESSIGWQHVCPMQFGTATKSTLKSLVTPRKQFCQLAQNMQPTTINLANRLASVSQLFQRNSQLVIACDSQLVTLAYLLVDKNMSKWLSDWIAMERHIQEKIIKK